MTIIDKTMPLLLITVAVNPLLPKESEEEASDFSEFQRRERTGFFLTLRLTWSRIFPRRYLGSKDCKINKAKWYNHWSWPKPWPVPLVGIHLNSGWSMRRSCRCWIRESLTGPARRFYVSTDFRTLRFQSKITFCCWSMARQRWPAFFPAGIWDIPQQRFRRWPTGLRKL